MEKMYIYFINFWQIFWGIYNWGYSQLQIFIMDYFSIIFIKDFTSDIYDNSKFNFLISAKS